MGHEKLIYKTNSKINFQHLLPLKKNTHTLSVIKLQALKARLRMLLIHLLPTCFGLDLLSVLGKLNLTVWTLSGELKQKRIY